MDENNGNNIKLGVSYSVDHTQIDNLTKSVSQLNSVTSSVAESLNSIKKGLSGFSATADSTGKSIDGTTNATKSFVKALQNEVDSGVKSAEKAYGELIARQKELQNILSTTKIGSDEYKKVVAELANVEKAITKYGKTVDKSAQTSAKVFVESEKQRLKQAQDANKQIVKDEQALLAMRTKSAKESANVFIEAEKQKSEQLKQLWQQELNTYNNLQKQLNTTSSLKSFSTGGTNNSLFNAGLNVLGVRALASEFQNLGGEIVDIQYNLVNTQRIMGDFSDETADFLLSNAAETASLTNTQITDVQELQSAWVRINDQYANSAKLLTDITTITAKFMNVGEIEDAEQAVALLNASLLQFGYVGDIAIEKAEEFTNKWAYMADITAMGTADEYGEAISKYGATVDALNGSMDESIALASIMADRLAKGGAEAGNALKTFTTYMNRTKTRNLFDEIAEDLDDTNYKLYDVNGGFKDFNDTLRTIAKAYKEYVKAGNDVMANQILEAVGATRQRDAALAVINAVNEGDYDTYLQELQSDKVDNYLNEQNAALLKTLSASLSAMTESLKNFAMVFANSGLLQGVDLMVDGLGGLFNALSKIPEPLLQIANGMLMFKGATSAAQHIGQLTGATQKYQVLLNQGTQEEIANANAISASANAYVERMNTLGNMNQLTEEQILRVSDQKQGLLLLTDAYNKGEISASDFSSAVQNLISVEELNGDATLKTVDAYLNKNVVVAKANGLTDQEQAQYQQLVLQKRADKAAEDGWLTTKLKSVAATQMATLEKGKEKVQNILVAASIKGATVAEEAHTFAKTKGIWASIQYAIQNGILGASFGTLGAAVGVATTALSSLMAVIAPIMAVVSLLSVGWNLLSGLFSNTGNSTKSASEKMEELNKELDEVNEKIKELNSLRGSTTDTTYYDKELKYWKERKQLIQDNIKEQKQLNAYDMLFKDDEENDDDNQLKRTKDAIKDLANASKEYKQAVNSLKYAEEHGYDTESWEKDITDARREMVEARSEAVALSQSLNTYYETLKGSGLVSDSELGDIKTTIESINTELDKLPKGDIGFNFDIEESIGEVQNLGEEINSLQDEMDSLFENMENGELNTSQIQALIDKYDGFYEVAGKSAQDQILFLKNLQLDKEAEQIGIISDGISQITTRKQEIYNALANNESGKIPMDDTEIEEANQELANLDTQLDELQARGALYLEAKLDLPDLSDLTSQMESLVSATSDLVEAQNKLAQGTALSKKELYDLAMTYPELLYQADLFNTTTVDGQQNAINAVMQMKEDEFNSKIDLQIAELEAQKTFIQGILAQEANKFAILAQANVDYANGRLDTEQEVQTMLDAYNNAIGEQYTLAEQYKLQKTEEGGQARVDTEDEIGALTTDIANNTADAMAEAIIGGSAAGVDGANTNAGRLGTVFQNIIKGAKSVWSWVKAAFSGSSSGGSGDGSVSGTSGSTTSTFKKATYNSTNKTINGKELGDWIKTQTKALNLNIQGYQVQLGKLDTAITNLEQLKKQGLANISNKYSSSGAQGGTTPSSDSSGSGSSGKSDTEKAIEEAMEAIQDFIDEYVKNVESMQDRIAKALKKKYQEQYDERKKLLEKEHNARVEQIQAEIDAINGNRPQDKQAELGRLKDKLAQWQQDNSTLGKARQKEYMDQIKALEKEITLDELEKKMDEENESYQNSIDSESEFYDAILKKLDQQMTDEYIYKEANYLIANNKQQDIIDLLTKYDAQWDGWATLMGKTAGEIIGEEVALALANYLDVKNGTITADGGVNTNKVLGVTSSSNTSSASKTNTSSSNSSSTKTVSKGKKVKISNGSAGMYYTSTSKSAVDNWKGYTSGQYYVVNESAGRVALARTNNISGAIGWIDKKYVTALATGGYTGDYEGLAYLHQKERVLSAQQTAAFDKLVYDFMPTMSSWLTNPKGDTFNNGGDTNFNSPLVQVNIDKLNQNKEFDVNNGIDNLGRMVKDSLRKSGINMGGRR